MVQNSTQKLVGVRCDKQFVGLEGTPFLTPIEVVDQLIVVTFQNYFNH